MTNKQAIAANKADRAALMTQWETTGVKPEAELAANFSALETLCAAHKGSTKIARGCLDNGAS